ncbi:MAG: hypothetical protein WKF47_07430 [Geodermatophilaceae bacterium]
MTPRRAVLDHLREALAASPQQIADALGMNYETVKKTCKRMFDDGQVDNDGTRDVPPLSTVPRVPGVPHDRSQGQGDTDEGQGHIAL